jgi:hypothetical protein
MTLISISLPLQYSTLKQMRGNAKEQVLEDYKDITQKLGQRFGAVDSDVSIGWGDNSTGDTYFLSFYRVYPVWKGAPYYFDLGIQMDMRIGGRQTSRKAEDAIKSCVYKFWLIPKNERPFEMKNYNTHEPIYQDWFIQTFHQSYRILDQSRYFDVWACTSVTEAPASIPNQ